MSKPDAETYSALTSETLTLYDEAKAIEMRYPNGLTKAENADDFSKVKVLLERIDPNEDRCAALEDKYGFNFLAEWDAKQR